MGVRQRNDRLVSRYWWPRDVWLSSGRCRVQRQDALKDAIDRDAFLRDDMPVTVALAETGVTVI